MAVDVEPEAEKPTPKPVFDEADARQKWVDLDHPFTLDGVRWERVPVRRCTAKEVSDYIDAFLSGNAADIMAPMIGCPVEVFEAMDADDQVKVDDEAKAFTPRRLLKLHEMMAKFDEQASTDGGNTSG